VRLAASEVRLQIDHRVPRLAVQPAQRPGQQRSQAFGQVGAPVELLRILVLIGGLFQVDLPQVRGKLGLQVATAGSRQGFSPSGGFPASGAAVTLRNSLRTISS